MRKISVMSIHYERSNENNRCNLFRVLISLFNAVSIFVGYLMPNPLCKRITVVLFNPLLSERERVYTFP